MTAYMGVKVNIPFWVDNGNEVRKLHEVYEKFGMKPRYVDGLGDADKFYNKAVEINQKCFNERVEFNVHMHRRISWSCDWISFVDTLPVISYVMDVNPNFADDRNIAFSRSEMILFPEEEAEKDEVFSKIVEFVSELYKLDFIGSVEMIKEEY